MAQSDDRAHHIDEGEKVAKKRTVGYQSARDSGAKT